MIAAVAAGLCGGVFVLPLPRLRRLTGRFCLVACGLVVVIGVLTEAGHWVRADTGLQALADSGESSELDVTLAGYPQDDASGSGKPGWVAATITSARGDVPVVLWLGPQIERGDAPWAPGARVMLEGVLVSVDRGGGAAYGVRVEAVLGAEVSASGAIAARLRQGLRVAAENVRGAELVPGFAVGDTGLVGERLEQHMLESSLTHLVAVSGANCALLIGAVSSIAGVLGAGRRLRVIIAGTALAGFVFIVGPDASVQRAAVMAAVMLVASFGGRRAASLPALGSAIVVLLIADPWQALHPGFALSVAATAGILLLVPGIERWLGGLLRAPRWLLLPVAVALAAQIACGPLLLLLQPGIPAAGILANVLAAPAAPAGTGLGLLALVLLPVAPTLGEACVFLASVPARWVAATAEVTAWLPAARWNWPEGWPGALLLAAVEVALILAWGIGSRHIQLFRRDREGNRRPWRPRSRLSRAGQVVVALLIGAALGTLSGPTLVAPLVLSHATPRDWQIVACDVGQGDAVLLRAATTPEQVLVVDTGDDDARLIACLDRFGVRRVELLVLTHDDRDHIGALGAVIDRTELAIIAPANRRDGEDRPLVDRLRSAEVPFRVGARGDRGSVGALEWEVLAPQDGTQPLDSNAASLVLRVDSGEVTTLLLADTGSEEQQLLRALGDEQLRAEVVKVAHHGSRDQDPALPAVVGARHAIFSVGAGNGYGHPTAETLRLYERAGARPLRTDVHGTIALSADGDELRVWAERMSSSGAAGAE